MNALYVFVGGGLGSLLRYAISWLVKKNFEGVFPLATLLSNFFSCLLLGATLHYVSREENSMLKLLLLTGFCGGFSTFSAFSYETVELVRQNHLPYAFANVLLSLLLGLFIVYVFIKNSA